MTIFVGPNNSGKSLVLRETQAFLETGPSEERRILAYVTVRVPPPDAIDELLETRRVPEEQGRSVPIGHIRLGKITPTTGQVSYHEPPLDHLRQQLEHLRTKPLDGANVWSGVYSQFLTLFTIALTGRTRFDLVDPRPLGDLQAHPPNHLAALFRNDPARLEVRRVVKDAFQKYFVLDPTNTGNVRIRLADREPVDTQEEQALDARARAFHASARDIAALSDGVKAFVGIISAVQSSDFRIIIIDEPEAFLHPPLARKLGLELTKAAGRADATVFTATHSAEFVMGCVDSGKPLNIIRLSYGADTPRARILSASTLRALMRDALLRSTGVIGALFHSGAVICEADRDRAFYQEVNTRLASTARASVRDSVFLNAQNKQTIRRIVEPLRNMGVPAAAIVDIDIIKKGGLKELLASCAVPEPVAHALSVLRGNVEKLFTDAGVDMKKGGVKALPGPDQAAALSLLSQLEQYGIFVVPIGEVESWLSQLGVTSTKQDWLPSIFEAMKSDPSEAGYVVPEQGDVWDFMERIAHWVHDENRLGMP